jgi:predicted CXXCH cytochrome family protein
MLLAGVVWKAGRCHPCPQKAAEPPFSTEVVDPRVAYVGPFGNLRPEVQYIGDERCAECHTDIAESYGRHPMGRSLTPIAELAPAQVYDEKRHNPFTALDSQFSIDRQGDHVWHRQARLDAAGRPIYEYAQEVHYAIGAGRGGLSYITNRNGYLLQTPISWYSQKDRWDVSPGFSADRLAGRPVTPDCLFCHSNMAHVVEGYQNRYELPVFSGHAIGCERCHGPGELHARSLKAEDIVNPQKLDPELREAVCQQCHLEGETRVLRRGRELYDFRPGLPLSDFWSVFVRAHVGREDQRAVHHVEQMYASKCFQASQDNAKLGCTSCHDPHVSVGPEQRAAYFRDRCLRCHDAQQPPTASKGCALPEEERRRQNPADSCSDCHMPRYPLADVSHTAATDHRILRRPQNDDELRLPAPTGGGLLLTPFGRRRLDVRDRDLTRDAGIALVQAASAGKVPASLASSQALGLLDTSLRDFPDDVAAYESRGWALSTERQLQPALAAFEAALARQPRREMSLIGAALTADMLGEQARTLDYWRRCVEMNPELALCRRHLALALMRQEAWDEVRPQVETWLRLDPGSAEGRMLRVTCLLREGHKAEAAAEFAQVEALRPPNLEQMRAMYSKLSADQ